MYKDWDKKMIVMGFEKGESGTPHIQGYIIFTRMYRLSQLKTLSPRAHWEKAKCADAANYCMKDGDYFLDDRRSQGQRTDLEGACALLKEKGIATLKDELPHIYVKYPRGFTDLVVQTKRRFKPHVVWIHGSTGSGKTRYVYAKEADADLWESGADLRWWQGYEAQPVTLFDDFRGDMCKFHVLLKYLDRYPCTVEVKGGSRQLVAKRMYITSCYHPGDVYQKSSEDQHQLLRRIDEIIDQDDVN